MARAAFALRQMPAKHWPLLPDESASINPRGDDELFFALLD